MGFTDGHLGILCFIHQNDNKRQSLWHVDFLNPESETQGANIQVNTQITLT